MATALDEAGIIRSIRPTKPIRCEECGTERHVDACRSSSEAGTTGFGLEQDRTVAPSPLPGCPLSLLDDSLYLCYELKWEDL